MNNLDDSSDIPLYMNDILSCVSDGVIVYHDYKILFSNTEGSLILSQTEKTLLNDLQFDLNEKNLHEFHIDIPEREEKLIAHCMPIHWRGEVASVAIVKTEHEYDSVLEPGEDSHQPEVHLHTRNRLDLLFKSAGDGYWDWYIPTANVFFSVGWKQMLGYAPEDIEPSFNTWISLIHPDDLGNFLLVWSDYMENDQQEFYIEYRIRCHNDEYRWVEAHGIKDLNEEGEIVRLAGFHRDINSRKINEEKLKEYQENLEQLVAQRTRELEEANRKLGQLASQDPLTLLQNRRSFDDNLKTQLLVARRNNLSLCLLIMDIDHFKSYNDVYGHQVGDDCIRAVATAIKQSIYRPTDFAARYGGEEFVVVLQDTDIPGGIKVAKVIQDNIAAIQGLPFNPTSGKQISLSIGISTNLQAGKQELVEIADKAMYAAKNNGRDQICHFDDALKTISYIIDKSSLDV